LNKQVNTKLEKEHYRPKLSSGGRAKGENNAKTRFTGPQERYNWGRCEQEWLLNQGGENGCRREGKASWVVCWW